MVVTHLLTNQSRLSLNTEKQPIGIIPVMVTLSKFLYGNPKQMVEGTSDPLEWNRAEDAKFLDALPRGPPWESGRGGPRDFGLAARIQPGSPKKGPNKVVFKAYYVL